MTGKLTENWDGPTSSNICLRRKETKERAQNIWRNKVREFQKTKERYTKTPEY